MDSVVEYNTLEKSFKASLEISSNVKSTDKFERFFLSDFLKNNIDLELAVLLFSKYCLQEYYYLIKTNKDKRICFILNCMSEDIFREFEKKNYWLDQLESLLDADGSSIVYRTFNTEVK